MLSRMHPGKVYEIAGTNVQSPTCARGLQEGIWSHLRGMLVGVPATNEMLIKSDDSAAVGVALRLRAVAHVSETNYS